MSITFEGQRSSDINLYVPLWNTSLRLTVGLWSISRPRQSKRGGTTSSSGQLWLQADPIHCLNSGAFSLYFWSRLLNAFLIDCDSDQWLAVAGLLSQSWIYSSFLPRAAVFYAFLPVWDWRRFINESQLPLLCLHTPATSWPGQCPVCLLALTHLHTK